jgi:cardiolipin synthase
VRNPLRPCPPSWPKLLGTAAVAGLGTLFIGRNFFPSEKKIGHKITADYSTADDVFVRMMGNLLGPPLVPGNEIIVLHNGDEIFPSMLAAIRSATRTITFENFLWQAGAISDEFADALAERAAAGVAVHFLQDAFGCTGLRGRAMNMLRASKVELEIFRFVNLTVNFRTHRKLLVIDGHTGFIGGVGIADDWTGNGRTRGLWRDLHYRVRGPAAAQFQQAFIDNWLETRATLLHGDAYFPKLETRAASSARSSKARPAKAPIARA